MNLVNWVEAAYAAGVVALLMWSVWVVSVPRRDVSIVDWVWGPAFALLGWVLLAQASEISARGLTVVAMTTLWAVRLTLHLVSRSRGRGEDPRYAAMRRRSGRSFWWTSLFKVFLLQGLLATIIAAPIFQAVRIPQEAAPWRWIDLLAAVVFLTGLVVEAEADRQLTAFRSDPNNRGRVLDDGLWRYTRHPNYFGDALVWWGLGLFACATPGGWPALIGPLVMTVLLVRVSGVALLEAGLKESRSGYREYMRRTPSFVPWFPQKDESSTSPGNR